MGQRKEERRAAISTGPTINSGAAVVVVEDEDVVRAGREKGVDMLPDMLLSLRQDNIVHHRAVAMDSKWTAEVAVSRAGIVARKVVAANAVRTVSATPQSNEPRGPEVLTPVQGILELHPKGYGFLRDPKAGYVSQDSDAFVSGSLIEKYGLREGVLITGENVPGGRGQGPRLKTIQTIEGRLPELYPEIKTFDTLTPINPFTQIRLETGTTPITMRVMDLLTPIGKGQRMDQRRHEPERQCCCKKLPMRSARTIPIST